MKLIVIVLLLGSFSALAVDNSKLGLGVSIGSPIGLHYMYDLDNKKRIEGAVGASLTGLGTSADAQYVSTLKNRFKLQAYNLDFNYGYGARILSGKNFKFGPSALAGVDHEIENTHFSILANSGAAFLFGDGLTLDLNLYLGANYHF